PERRRHGRGVSLAAGDRLGPRQRAAPDWRVRRCRAGRAHRFGESHRTRERATRTGASIRKIACRGPGLRARDDQAHAGLRRPRRLRHGDRSRGASTSDLHAAPRLPRGLRGLERQARAAVRMSDAHAVLTRPLLDDACIEAGWHAPARGVAALLAAEASAKESGAALRALATEPGRQGTLRLIVSGRDGGLAPEISWRAVCLARERLAHASPLVELAFAMQGLGSYPITLRGSDAERARWLGPVVRGEAIAAFALTE